MAIQTDELIKEIAVKHGVAVNRNDPIMILATVHAQLVEDNAKAQQELLDRYKEEMEALTARWSGAAKEDAERILNVALGASRNLMRDAANEVAAVIRTESDAALSRVAFAVQQARIVVMLNFVASCVTLIVVAMAVWATMG